MSVAELLQTLSHALTRCPAPVSRWVVGYSGGGDSHVLLACLAQLRPLLGVELAAIHVHHGLSPQADVWATHCLTVCAALSVPCTVVRVDVDVSKRAAKGLESAARDARYNAFGTHLRDGDALLLAHHQDDQVETVLLRLLRGAGPYGLQGMQVWAQHAHYWMGRPWLTVGKSTLLAAAQELALVWVEDDSNRCLDLRRNFLRQDILPRLRTQWPGLNHTVARSAQWCQESVLLTDGLARDDYQQAVDSSSRLQCSVLWSLSVVRQKNLLRYWLRRQQVLVPSAARFRCLFLMSQSNVAPDAHSEVAWGEWCVRRYRNRLSVLARGPDLARAAHRAVTHAVTHPVSTEASTEASTETSTEKTWSPLDTPIVSWRGGFLSARRVYGQGIQQDLCLHAPFELTTRKGGERCRMPGRTHHHSLKKCFQMLAVPPWERAERPLIMQDGVLIAVASLFVCEGYQAQADEWGVVIEWRPGVR